MKNERVWQIFILISRIELHGVSSVRSRTLRGISSYLVHVQDAICIKRTK